MDRIGLCFVSFLAIVSSVATDQGFWNIRLNPQSVAVIPFHSFHISVWEHATIRGRYFASPLACIQPETAQLFENFFTAKHQVNFNVLLWSKEARETVYNYMKSRVNATIQHEDVELLPMERIRVVWKNRQQPLPEYYQVDSEWRANNHLPTDVTFHILCADRDKCATLETGMKTTPEAFHGLHFEYEINSQKTSTKRLVVKGQHLIGGQLYTRLANMPVESGVRFLTNNDVSRLASETITNVLTAMTTDEDYVDDEDEVSVTDMLRAVLQRQSVSTGTFSPGMWDFVFWRGDVGRPDKRAQYLNRVLTMDATDSSRFLLNQSERNLTEEALLGLRGLFNVTVGASSSTAMADKNKVINATQRFGNGDVQWGGEKFIVKPMHLTRLNLATLNQSITIVSSQVQIRRLDSVKSIQLRAGCGAGKQAPNLPDVVNPSRQVSDTAQLPSGPSQRTNIRRFMERFNWPEYCYLNTRLCTNGTGFSATIYEGRYAGSSLPGCRSECSDNSRCQAFVHYPGDNKCWLLQATCPPNNGSFIDVTGFGSELADHYYRKMTSSQIMDGLSRRAFNSNIVDPSRDELCELALGQAFRAG